MVTKTILVTQARTGSSRLPGKVLMKVGEKTLLQIHLERLSQCKTVQEIIVATTDKEEDTRIFNSVVEWGFAASRGSEQDVLDRFYQAVKEKAPDWIVRVTSDCPLLDPALVDEVVTFVQETNKDYGSNGLTEQFPDGQDIEVFKFSALETAWKNAKLKSEREHVTPYIRNNADNKGENFFNIVNFPSQQDFSIIRMTVDEAKDFELIEILINAMGTEKSWLEYTEYIIENDLMAINNQITRNEGFLKSLKKDN